jgi:hypothetical protein
MNRKIYLKGILKLIFYRKSFDDLTLLKILRKKLDWGEDKKQMVSLTNVKNKAWCLQIKESFLLNGREWDSTVRD